MISSVIPQNIDGKSIDLHEQVVDETIEQAMKTFKRACLRLVNPHVWHLIAGPLSAEFILFCADNIDNKKLAEVGDFFMVDIPGPGSRTGDGYDWVKVEAILQNSEPYADESMAMTLRASTNPESSNEAIAHFFTDNATATFIVKRTGNKVSASYHGRNEIANTEGIPMLDKIRNKLMAAGAEAGLASLQWRALINGLLQPEIGG